MSSATILLRTNILHFKTFYLLIKILTDGIVFSTDFLENGFIFIIIIIIIITIIIIIIIIIQIWIDQKKNNNNKINIKT